MSNNSTSVVNLIGNNSITHIHSYPYSQSEKLFRNSMDVVIRSQLDGNEQIDLILLTIVSNINFNDGSYIIVNKTEKSASLNGGVSISHTNSVIIITKPNTEVVTITFINASNDFTLTTDYSPLIYSSDTNIISVL